MKRLLILVLLVALAAGGYLAWRVYGHGSGGPTYRTVAVERGDLLATISATGTLQPEEVVDVGAQVAGRIVSLGDPKQPKIVIDYTTQVEEGTVLARIDDSLYRADVKQAKAQLEQAEGQLKQAEAQVEEARANLKRAEADRGQLQAKLRQNENDWQRVKRLKAQGGVVAETDVDLAEANFKTAQASLAVGEAAIAQARASLRGAEENVPRVRGIKEGAEAALEKAQINLDFCTIRSPVKGVIIERRVNVGQTVVASLNAPSLFLIAKDLSKMQIWASVNEADIGQIKLGQPVRFTVDARPGEEFQGTVTQVRDNAVMTQNVVTYTVVINTDNSKNKLKPYLTANVTFEVAERKNALLVPNSALRWQPKREQVSPAHREEFDRLSRRKAPGQTGSGAESRKGVVWVEDENGLVKPIKVKMGLTDGSMTEIIGGELHESDRVIVGLEQPKNGNGGGNEDANPFAPRMFGPRRQQ